MLSSSNTSTDLNETEAQIQRAIITYVKKFLPNHIIWKNHVGAITTNRGRVTNPAKGIPDLMGFTPEGKFFSIEVKTKTGKLSYVQKEWRDAFQRLGVPWLLARSIDDVMAFLEDL